MEERDLELPVATLRPGRIAGRGAALRGDLGRWVRTRFRNAFTGRHAPLVLTGIFFSGMMLAMGYVADRAQHAAEGIDRVHSETRRRAQAIDVEVVRDPVADEARLPDPWPRSTAAADAVLFYVRR